MNINKALLSATINIGLLPPSYQRSAQMPYPLTLPLDQTVYVMMQEVALRCTLSPLPGAHGKATKIPLMA